jgi:hypothetical protein
MSKARRQKRAGTYLTKQQLEAAASEMLTEGGGAWTVDFCPIVEVPGLEEAALNGDVTACAIIEGFSTMITAAASADKPRCLTCEAMFSKRQAPAYLVLAHADSDDPSHALMSAICFRCAEKGEDAMQAATLDAYRRIFLPDMREIAISECAGRA